MKYNLDDLHWQEFETLVFKILQIIVAPGVVFLKGGNDKGRDLVYKGTSKFNPSYNGDWIFQVKHKSRLLDQLELTKVLVSDLKSELKKVFVTNALQYNVYILITNKEISANLYDKLEKTFLDFKKANGVNCNHFTVIGYHHIQSCIDNSDNLKWQYPNIISQPDFEILIQKSVNIHLENRRKGWVQSIKKQRERFVFTKFFEEASTRLKEFPAIILSGPPKSGKSFNAEILALNLSVYQGYQPVIIETLEDLEKGINQKIKQVFIFDDAFGRYSLSYESREWFSRINYIFELADESHLLIFTSREYIFREFLNYGNEDIQKMLKKIIVESHNYTNEEKLAMLRRYTLSSPLSESAKTEILLSEGDLILHKNYSPETIRAFFSNLNSNDTTSPLYRFKLHLDKPDSYLHQVFFKLNPAKQAVLISVLCSVRARLDVQKRTFDKICKDLELKELVDASIEFDELDDSILRISKDDTVENVRFYHPSMDEFLIRQITKDDSRKLKETVLKNLNGNLISISFFKSSDGSWITPKQDRDVEIGKSDLSVVELGLSRLIQNDDCSLYQLVEAFGWFPISQHTIDLRIHDPQYYREIQNLLSKLIGLVFSESFFWSHREDSFKAWSDLLWVIRNSIQIFSLTGLGCNYAPLKRMVLNGKGANNDYMLILRSQFFLGDDGIKELVGRDWLNKFYIDLSRDVDELGLEVYGDDYPHFNEYKAQKKIQKTSFERMKVKPNRTWYPRFISVEYRVDILNEMKGSKISNIILNRLDFKIKHVHRLKHYAKNRHRFIVSKGWWQESEISDIEADSDE